MRRAVGVAGAVLVALLGTMLLVGYVRGAEERALAGEELTEVLVVKTVIPRGTPALELVPHVTTELVPLKVRAEGSVDDLGLLAGLVTATDLMPGEQVLTSRFVTAETLSLNARIEAPADTLEVTVSLSPDRALGGGLVPGDLVAVIASFDPFELNAIEPTELAEGTIVDPSEIFVGTSGGDQGTSLKTPPSTHLILHKVLVTNVQVEQLPRATAEDLPDDAPPLAPTGNLLITLAAPPESIERIVFTAEHGFMWLAASTETTPEPDTPVQTRATVYR